MADVLTSVQRKRCMSAIRGKDTKPEMVIRRLVHAMGYRYSLHLSSLPGKPDLVFTRHEKIIFVHGCFWHMHNCKYGRVKPKTNADFWKKKRETTVLRDKENIKKLRKLGWKILIVWECQTRPKRQKWIMKKLISFLS